jgi:hypothetical protein
VQRLHKEIPDTFKYSPDCWKQRFTEIRQRNMGMIKVVGGLNWTFDKDGYLDQSLNSHHA